MPGQQDVSTLQQEENVSISGSNARLMIMKKLSRKAEVSDIIINCDQHAFCACVNTAIWHWRNTK